MNRNTFQKGREFLNYQLVEKIGAGGMGEVWKAKKVGSQGWSKTVVLKIILKEHTSDSHFLGLFFREAQLGSMLGDNPNIVGIDNYGYEGGVPYVETKYIDGEDLERISNKGRIPQPLVLYIVGEVLKALQYAHEHQVVHRDVKPANVLVSKHGGVFLADFGIAKVIDEHMPTTMARGTPGNTIPPEVLHGEQPSPRADVFAVGVMFWELLTRKKLFDGPTDAVRLLKTMECVVPSLAEEGVAATPELEMVLRTMLRADPTARYLDAGAALSALQAVPGMQEGSSAYLRSYLVVLDKTNTPTIQEFPAFPGPESSFSAMGDAVPEFVPEDVIVTMTVPRQKSPAPIRWFRRFSRWLGN